MNEEKKLFDFSNRVFNLFAILVVGILVFLIAQMFYNQKSLEKTDYQISVSGEGKVLAVPDVATVSLGVRTDGNSVEQITEQNTNIMNNIIQSMKDLGIAEEDIKTTQYSINPQYTFTERGRIPNGYTIQQSISVKIRNFDIIGDVFSKATEMGVNSVGSLQFMVDNIEQLKAEARAIAITNAKEKAQQLAKESGIRLGRVLYVYEDYPIYPAFGGDTEVRQLGLGSVADETLIIPNIQEGEQEITSSVSLTYQVK